MRNWENLVTNGFRLTHFGSSRWFYADTSEKREKFQELGFQTFPSMDTFPSKYFPHHVLTFVRKERRIKSYKVEIWIPTHWLADVLVTDSSETKWSRSETHVDGEAANMAGYKMNQTISDLLKRGPNQLIMFVVLFTRPVFQATDLIIELASTVWPVVTCLLGTMVIWSFGQWSNTRRGGILPRSAVLYQDVLFAFHHGLFGSTYCVGRLQKFVILLNPNVTLK